MNNFDFKMTIEAERDINGYKRFYCWQGDILLIGTPREDGCDWQDVIYGNYCEGGNDFMGLGIKRNGEPEENRSGKYYQVVASPLKEFIIAGLLAELKNNPNAVYENVLQMIIDKSPCIDEIKDFIIFSKNK